MSYVDAIRKLILRVKGHESDAHKNNSEQNLKNSPSHSSAAHASTAASAGSNDGQTYHPTEHGGLRKDDQRVKGHESEAHKATLTRPRPSGTSTSKTRA
ncbi:hypothetical protein HDU90_002328 [Geranomyces variabilis]|nr:hypothetical protein HDU90_002328 [Geranomyces variabilis]